MNIAPFKLPSDDSKVIFFSKPDVETAMEYASCTPDIEESMTTLYLNALQKDEKTFSDSTYWTAQDRRMALWWIYVESNVDLSLTALYECDRCTAAAKKEYERAIAAGEKAVFKPVQHSIDYNAADFQEGVSWLAVAPYQMTNHKFNGVDKKVKLVLLNGAAVEGLEKIRASIDLIPDDKENEKAKKGLVAEMRMIRLCYQMEIEGEPEGLSEALKFRYEHLIKMSSGDEFKSLVAKISLMNRQLAHGLDISIVDGVSRIRVPKTDVCPMYYQLSDAQKAKESISAYTTQLWINFRNIDLFPNLRLTGLADFID